MESAVWVARPVGQGRHQLGEGPHWDAGRTRLSWVDIVTGALWVQDGPEASSLVLGEPLGVAVPHADGGWVCGLGRGVAHVADDGAVVQRVDLEPVGVRMNDGKCDRLGRFFVGSKALDNREGAGCLWRLDLDGSVSRVLSGLTIANGLGWSPDDTTMYVTDSASGSIDAYAYDLAMGTLGAGRPFLRLGPGEGAPDGLAVDATGHLWVAVWGGREVRRFSPAGELAGVVRVGVSLPTSCAFTGASLTTLTITTAWDELTDVQRAGEPDAGRLHQAEVGIPGTPGQPCRVARASWAVVG
jgi:sugar lactone lactonase YvrE